MKPYEYTMKVLNSANITHSVSKHVLRAIKDRVASESMEPTKSGRERPEGCTFAGAQCIANDTGLAKATVVDAFNRLESNCFIERIQYFHPNGGQGSSYILLKVGNDIWVNPLRKRRNKKRKVIGDTNEGVPGVTNEGVPGITDGGVPCDTDDITMQLRTKKLKPAVPQSTQNLQQTHAHVRRTRVERIQDSQNREAHQTSQPTPPLGHTTATGVNMGGSEPGYEERHQRTSPFDSQSHNDARKFVRDWERTTGVQWCLDTMSLEALSKPLRSLDDRQRLTLITMMQTKMEKVKGRSDRSQWGKNRVENPTGFCRDILTTASEKARYKARTAPQRSQVPPVDAEESGGTSDAPTPHLDNVVSLEIASQLVARNRVLNHRPNNDEELDAYIRVLSVSPPGTQETSKEKRKRLQLLAKANKCKRWIEENVRNRVTSSETGL